MKISQFSSIILVAGLLIAPIGATAVDRLPATVGPSGQTVVIPPRAVEVAPNVFDLGAAIDPADGRVVQGYAIVHKARGEARGGGGKPGSNACYGFMAKGAKWKTLESWVVNPANTYGISDTDIAGILSGGITKWEAAATKNILGDGAITSTALVADESAPDNANEVYFAPLDNGTIGVTIVWGIFGGPTFSRELREWDQVYNTAYNWAVDGSADKMDFDNIATHELGHSLGLADLYTLSCGEETMYGYGTEGETKKRDLGPGDIAGIKELYK